MEHVLRGRECEEVTLDPARRDVWPAATRCMPVNRRRKQRSYVLTAVDANGNKLLSDLPSR